MNPQPMIDAMRTTARAMQSGDVRERLQAVQVLQDCLDAVKAEALAELEASKDYELDGASTLGTWVRSRLRLSAKETAALVRGAHTLAQLPAVAEAAEAGTIRAAHVAVFTYGLKHIGADVVTGAQPWLLDVARTCEPNELFKVMRALREAVYPDELDKAWMDGMDRQDIQVNPVPGGWHITGFLNATAGEKFKAVLDSVAKPVDAGDDRPGSERRVQGFDDLLTKILDSGLPNDKGVRPHLSVIADAETLQAALAGEDPAEGTRPAELAGYGPIGPKLLGYLACISDFTPVLTQRPGDFSQSRILNVGRSQRHATLKQRRAIIARQNGICAAPGCKHTHLEMHHTIWYSQGGRTDLDVMIGLCVRCHHLHHRGLLNIHGTANTGYTFTTKNNRPLAKTTNLRR